MIIYFIERKEEFSRLLVETGFKKSTARVLVFLANTPVATSRAIEQGTGLRQPEVSIAAHYLEERGWIRRRVSQGKERAVTVYELARPLADIVDSIGQEKTAETDNQLRLIRKLRDSFI